MYFYRIFSAHISTCIILLRRRPDHRAIVHQPPLPTVHVLARAHAYFIEDGICLRVQQTCTYSYSPEHTHTRQRTKRKYLSVMILHYPYHGFVIRAKNSIYTPLETLFGYILRILVYQHGRRTI